MFVTHTHTIFTTSHVLTLILMMQIFAGIAENTVAKPIAVLSLDQSEEKGGKMKLLITEYCSSYDEQFANQFIEGLVDPRTADAIGAAFADLNTRGEVPDPEFNLYSVDSFEGAFSGCIDWMNKVKADETNKTNLRRLLQEVDIDKIFGGSRNMYHQRKCLCHNDRYVKR